MPLRKSQCARCDTVDAIKERGKIARQQEYKASPTEVSQPEFIKCPVCSRLMDAHSGDCLWCERDRSSLTRLAGFPERTKPRLSAIILGTVGTLFVCGVGAWFAIHSSNAGTAAPAQVTKQAKVTAVPENSGNSQPSDVEMLTYSQTQTKEALEAKLKDPESARYKNVAAYHVAGFSEGYAFCGEVNAKNGFGGYAGYERFVGVPDQAFLESEVSGFDTLWNRFCDPSQIGPAIWW